MYTKIALLSFLGLYSVCGKLVKPKPYPIIQQTLNCAGDYKFILKQLHEIKGLVSGNERRKGCQDFGNKHVKNVALRKKVIQTTQLDNVYHSIVHALNGNIYDVYASKLTTNPAFRVDLGRMYHVFEVEIYNRKRCHERFRDVDIKVGRTMIDLKLCGHYNGPAKSRERVTIHCPKVMTGRFVEIKLTKHKTYMNFAEVMVWGTEI